MLAARGCDGGSPGSKVLPFPLPCQKSACECLRAFLVPAPWVLRIFPRERFLPCHGQAAKEPNHPKRSPRPRQERASASEVRPKCTPRACSASHVHPKRLPEPPKSAQEQAKSSPRAAKKFHSGPRATKSTPRASKSGQEFPKSSPTLKFRYEYVCGYAVMFVFLFTFWTCLETHLIRAPKSGQEQNKQNESYPSSAL